jgi:hypothetical protein
MSDTICKDLFDQSLKMIETKMIMMNKMSKKPASKSETNKILKKIIKFKKSSEQYKKFLDNCKKSYYNKGCVGTLFESGKSHDEYIKEELERQGIKINDQDYKMMYKLFLSTRKNIFKNKKNVLKDDFYEKLSKEDVNLLKSKGAISGCTVLNPFNTKAVNKFTNKIFKKVTNAYSRANKKNTTKKSKK